jgi:Raf kinase inhibitor-like YbhB/YbcL family protein
MGMAQDRYPIGHRVRRRFKTCFELPCGTPDTKRLFFWSLTHAGIPTYPNSNTIIKVSDTNAGKTKMRLTSESFANNQSIPARCAFGVADPKDHMQLGENRNPQLSWSEIPDDARSLVLVCIDTDVPSSMDDFNQDDRTISAGLPRIDFTHWVMIDIPATDGSVAEGQCSDGITQGGKQSPAGPPHSRQGINDYTGFMADDKDMQGDYCGYDGPCPPWNDEIKHHYRFWLYAISLDTCPVNDRFTSAEVLAAIDGHVVAEAKLTGIYSLNPAVAGPAS